MPCTHMEQATIHERHYQKKNCVHVHKIASYAIAAMAFTLYKIVTTLLTITLTS